MSKRKKKPKKTVLKLDKTSYFLKLTEQFESLRRSGNEKDRAYVSAICSCFDTERCIDTSVAKIQEVYGFDKVRPQKLGFVLPRNKFIVFYFDELGEKLVTKKLVKSIGPSDFRRAFDRKPVEYGQSKLWCTIAEWYTVLSLGSPPRLPTPLVKFAEDEGIVLPNRN